MIERKGREELGLHLSGWQLTKYELVLSWEMWSLQEKQIIHGTRTEWSPIQSVIIRVINKIGQPRSRSLICLTTKMITERIGWHEVLLQINHIYNKICDILGFLM